MKGRPLCYVVRDVTCVSEHSQPVRRTGEQIDFVAQMINYCLAQ